MKKNAGLLAGLLALSLVCSACGSSSKSAPSAAPAAMNNQMEYVQDTATTGFASQAAMEELGNPAGEVAAAVPDQRKIVRRSSLELETMAFDTALNEIERLVAEKGGYIENQTLDGRSYRYQGDYYERSANLTARIPSEKLDELTSSLGGLCNIVSQSEHREDITDSYFDTQARLDTLKLQEERLLDILSKAEKLEDVITLESALSETRYQIEALTASMKRMDSQVTYSFLEISLREVAEYQETVLTPKSFGEKFSLALERGGSHFVNATQGFVLVLAEGLPTLLLWVVLICGILLIVRMLGKGVRKRKDAKLQARLVCEEAARREKAELEQRLKETHKNE